MGLTTLPRTLTLHDGRTIELLLLEVSDCLGLVEFYRNLPEQDRQVLKDDANDLSPNTWTCWQRFGRTLPI